jgi:S-adenosylhomocysteine hydrolase
VTKWLRYFEVIRRNPRRDIDDEIARLKLESLGVAIDELTPEQEAYLSAWTGRAPIA